VDQLRRAILEPDAEVLDANRTFRDCPANSK
jgi:hypothetical protein